MTDADEWRVPKPAPCPGCGGQHGAVNALILCLTRAIAQRDADLREARVALASRPR